jgi:hypothetical protein
MWLRNASRDGDLGRTKLRLGAAAGLTLALSLAGCSADYVENNASPVILVIDNINEGSPLLSDVRGGATGDSIVNCQTKLTVESRAKNPTTTLGTSAYRRTDGRGAQGVDVPYTISGNISALVAAGGQQGQDLTIDLVRHQAKLEPPLSNINGLQVVTMFADVTIFGQTISGQSVSAQGSVQVTFADFADGTSTCEGS